MKRGDTATLPPGPRGSGRPSKIGSTVEVVRVVRGKETRRHVPITQAICDAVRMGVTVEGAAEAVGIAVSTLYEWRRIGEADERAGRATDEAQFSEAIRQALGESETVLVAHIASAAPRDHRAAQFLLERRFPDRYGRREHMDVTSAGGAVGIIETIRRKERERGKPDEE